MLIIKCPVCSDAIPYQIWSQLVDPEITQIYNQFNAPYRPMLRSCHSCGQSLQCAEAPLILESERQVLASNLTLNLETYVKEQNHTQAEFIQTAFQLDFDIGLQKRSLNVKELHRKLIKELLELPRPDFMTLALISSDLIRFETRPDVWQELQFEHVSYFPQVECPECAASLCFACGEAGHPGLDCLSFLKHQIEDESGPGGTLPKETKKSLEWKYKNSKACPRCKIMITRDDGCNRMECSYCGFAFCWECLSKFERGSCGFYRCKLASMAKALAVSSGETLPSVGSKAIRVETGVPDVARLLDRSL